MKKPKITKEESNRATNLGVKKALEEPGRGPLYTRRYSFDGSTLLLNRRKKLPKPLTEKEEKKVKFKVEHPVLAKVIYRKPITTYRRERKKGESLEEYKKTKYVREGRIDISKVRAQFRAAEGAKGIKRREKAVSGTLRAMGITGGSQKYAGAGRPRGTYKYGMPIQVYKQKMREQKAQYEQYQQEQYNKLATRGFTPEQVQALQQQQAVEELQQPTQPQAIQQLQARQQRIQMLQQAQAGQMPQQIQQNQNIVRQRYAQDMPFNNPSDEELEFTRWRAERTVSPNTQRMLQEVRRIQLLGKTSNIEQARRLRERKMMANQLNLMKAHENMTKVHMDFTGVSEENILMAPSIWKENPENNILKARGTSILNTQNGGNTLKFF